MLAATQDPTKAQSSKIGRREDSEAQLEILRNVKIFLTEKLKKSEEQIKTLQNDISVLKDYLRVEKQVHLKTKQQLDSRELELDTLRRESGEREGELRLQTLALSASLADKDKHFEEVHQQKKTLKMHKKVLKDEVLRLRKEVNEWELRA